MNLRKKKKLEKRLGCKTYYKYRSKVIGMAAQRMIDTWSKQHPDRKDAEHVVYISDSKKGDLRHIQNLSVFYDVYPVSVGDNSNTKQVDMTVTFSCPVYTGDSLAKEVAEHL